MTRVIELTVGLALLAAAPAFGQSRPQTPPPPPPGVTPQPVGRGAETTSPTQTQRQPPASQAGTSPRQPTGTPAPTATTAAPAAAAPATGAQQAAASLPGLPDDPTPTEAQLGVPVYPGAKFLRSYDAGQGQRYYLFGATASFAELVAYYRTQLRDRGDLVYDVPPVHMFEVGRFREETMAFPPGVTVKDYTWGGRKGYLVPIPGASPSHYPTIIQIVPVVTSR